MVAGLYVIRPVLIFMRSKGDFHKRFAEGGADYQRTMALLVLRQKLVLSKGRGTTHLYHIGNPGLNGDKF